MFREMRRNKQLLPEADAIAILNAGTSGVLAVSGDDGYPYAVPLSYVCHGGKLFFHCATTGHKLDGIHRNEKVSFCVIAQDDVQPDRFTTHFRSVIVFGRARLLTDDAARQDALERLAEKYAPGSGEEGRREILKSWQRTAVVEIQIEHMTGKEAIELVQSRT